jgi:hypothetical protein
MGDPELIIIDEPTEGLAPKIVELVGQFLRELRNREFVELEKLGVKGVSLGAAAAAKFGEEARNASYERMRERLAKIGASDDVSKFKNLFAPAK